eukprot:1431171-Rhodomonas_salina.1
MREQTAWKEVRAKAAGFGLDNPRRTSSPTDHDLTRTDVQQDVADMAGSATRGGQDGGRRVPIQRSCDASLLPVRNLGVWWFRQHRVQEAETPQTVG